jgi:prephenate dehydrogenase
MPFKVLVVGGAGGMGRWCARVLKHAGFEVFISSRKDATEVARSIGVSVSSPQVAEAFDMIVLSVPIDAIDEVASGVAPGMKPGSLLMDMSSLKMGPVESMMKYAPPGVDVIGAHPLFGPDSDGRGRTLVLVPTTKSERWLPIIRDVFKDEGFNVIESTADEHDRTMAVVQGLTHFMYIAMARTLERSDVDMAMTSAFRTPVYGITKELMGRVISQSPGLYALIQSSKYAGEMRRAYIDACLELASKLDSGDTHGFIEDIEDAARYYGDIAGAKKRSERIIQKDMEDKLSVMDAIGKERAFYVEGKAVYGIVKSAGVDEFTLETHDGPLTLMYEDVSPISGNALKALKDGKEPFINRDILVKMPIGADPAILKWVIQNMEGVRCVNSDTMDALGNDHILCHFFISVPADGSEEVLQRILKTIWGLGLEVR